uniref:ABC transporter domain-containing protein n=1 Tax=Electrophorus electricus TaxID=8005 RepID=A0AAY5EM46_ELEEL
MEYISYPFCKILCVGVKALNLIKFYNDHHSSVQCKQFILSNCLCFFKSSFSSSSGVMKPGLNAILGATGSGKSSFLDVLAARKDPTGLSGEVLIDGAPQPPNFKCQSGYVVQDDVVMGTLTVRENLCFSAALRLPMSISQKEKEQKVERVIDELGLNKVADSRVGTQLIRGISGGERKRTTIGMEIIIDPSVLFLDEPTTGLDASTANSVLSLLKRPARDPYHHLQHFLHSPVQMGVEKDLPEPHAQPADVLRAGEPHTINTMSA